MTKFARRVTTLCALLAVMFLCVDTSLQGHLLGTQPSSKVPVFVKAAATAGGFTDPSKDRQDSVDDLTDKLRDPKVMQLVKSETDAVILLEVLGRDTRREVNGWSAISGSGQNKSYLTVRLTAGEYTTELTGESGSKGMLKGYGAAAGRVVEQLDKWVKANRDRLVAIAQ